MEKVVIDRFIVPEKSKPAFLEAVRNSASFLRTLPGFVEGFVYEQRDGSGRDNVITTAVWADEQALANARTMAAAEFTKRGFNPQETMKALGVEMERALYERSPY